MIPEREKTMSAKPAKLIVYQCTQRRFLVLSLSQMQQLYGDTSTMAADPRTREGNKLRSSAPSAGFPGGSSIFLKASRVGFSRFD